VVVEADNGQVSEGGGEVIQGVVIGAVDVEGRGEGRGGKGEMEEEMERI
jgi:hypothetical protein